MSDPSLEARPPARAGLDGAADRLPDLSDGLSTEISANLSAHLPDGGAQSHFRLLLEKSADAILLLREERIVDANPAALRLFQCEHVQRMVGRRLLDFSPLQQPDGAVSSLLGAALAEHAAHAGNCRYDWRFLNCHGELFWAEVLLTALDPPRLSYAVLRDISARKVAEHALSLAGQVFDHARDAILVIDRQRRIIAVNRAYTEITGFGRTEIIGNVFNMQHLDPDSGEPVSFHPIWAELASAGHWQGEIQGQRKNKEQYPAWLSLTAVHDSLGQVGNYTGILSDITERKKSEEHTRHLAEHDFLTDLPNRVLLLDRLSLALVAARRKHSMLAILFLDLDHFKNINDSMGHHAGDLLLKEVARRLIKCVRGVDTVSRQGGDEFIIMLADIGAIDQVAHVAASVLLAVTQPYSIAGHELHVSTSIGVSVFPSDADDMETLIKNADIAMYHAKERGRNGFQFFDAEMNARIVERASFENELRRALDQHEFMLEYQPQIAVASGAMLGAEALIRWRHPRLGLLAPQRFIAVAEECGLMGAIGDWVLFQACRQASLWQQRGQTLVVAVNLAAAQFMQQNLPATVAAALDESGLAPHLLELELTEAILVKGGDGVASQLRALRALGVRLTIDDFGAGCSRLGLLRDYPVDKLKIDRSFMADIETGGQGDGANRGALLTAIIALAGSLQLTISAEGVENGEQLDFLRRHGCDEYQGFHASAATLAAALARSL